MKTTLIFLSIAALIQADDFAFLYPKEINLSCERDFSLYADALALQAKEGGLDFAITDSNGLGPRINGKVHGFSNQNSDYDINPGLRVGMGFLFGSDRWNCDFVWSFLKITNSKSVNVEGMAVLIPLWLVPVGVPNSTNQSLHATWEANFNLFDIRMGKAVHISEYLAVNPHIGGRIAFLDQHFAVNYGGFFGAVKGAISHNDNDFAGFGIRGGFDTEWEFGKNIGLFTQVSASLLWAHFETAQQLVQGTTQGYNITQSTHQTTPNLDITLGIEWGKSLNRDQFRLNARLAYEFQEWWDMNQLRRYSSPTASGTVSQGDFTLNGASLRLQIDL